MVSKTKRVAFCLVTVAFSVLFLPAQPAPLTQAPLCRPFPGTVLLDAESLDGWSLEFDGCGMDAPEMSLVEGFLGQSIRLDYDFRKPQGDPSYCDWAQLRYDFPEPRDFSQWDILRFRYRGGGAKNHLQVWLHDADDDRVGIQIDRVTDLGAWTYYTLPYTVPSRGIGAGILRQPFGWPFGDGDFDVTRVKKLFFAVSRNSTASQPEQVRSGSLSIDQIELVDRVGQVDSAPSEEAVGDPDKAAKAAAWIAGQQQDSGLVHSWREENAANGLIPQAHVYDQALALIVFMRSGRLEETRELAERLLALQNPDGSWFKWYRADDPENFEGNEKTLWEGDVAWAAYALVLLADWTGEESFRESAVRACEWLAGRIASRDGDGDPLTDGSVHNGIEANLDAWFAFQITGGFEEASEKVRQFLLNSGWDAARRRFTRGPVAIDAGNAIDVHTWGSEFLRVIGDAGKALDTLDFSCGTLPTSSFDGRVSGFDGQGPFSVWFEGVGQWIAAGGSHSQVYLDLLNANQEEDGSFRNSPDDFAGEGIWLSRWHGVAPTSWSFFANTIPVFSQGFIEGTVYQPDGETPAAGGRVRAFRPGAAEVVSEAALRPHGSYRLSSLDDGPYVIEVEAEDTVFTRPEVFAARLAERRKLDLTLVTNLYHAQFGDGRTDVVTAAPTSSAQVVEISSEIFLVNRDEAQSAQAIIRLEDDQGEPLQGVKLGGEVLPGGSGEFAVPAGGLEVLRSGAEGQIQVGSATVTSAAPLAGVVVFNSSVGAAGVGASPIVPVFRAPIFKTDETNTGIAIQNPSANPLTIDLELRNPDGEFLATGALLLPGRGHRALFVDQIPWALGPGVELDFSDFEGLLAASAREGTVAGVVIQTRAREFVTMPVAVPQSGGDPELYFAQFGDGEQGSASISSTLVLLNLSPRQAGVQIFFRGDNGSFLEGIDLAGETLGSGSTEVTIPAGGMRTLATDGKGPLLVGSATVISDEPLAGVVVFDSDAGAAGVGSSVPLDAFAAPMVRDEKTNTGIAIQNIGDDSIRVELELRDSKGQLLARSSLDLEAQGHRALFVDQIAWRPEPGVVLDLTAFEGLLKASSSGARMTATVIQTRGHELFVTMPVSSL